MVMLRFRQKLDVLRFLHRYCRIEEVTYITFFSWGLTNSAQRTLKTTHKAPEPHTWATTCWMNRQKKRHETAGGHSMTSLTKAQLLLFIYMVALFVVAIEIKVLLKAAEVFGRVKKICGQVKFESY